MPAVFSPVTVDDLVAQITAAGGNGEADTIDLGGQTFLLTESNNTRDGANGLPSILPDGGLPLTLRNGTIARVADTPAFRILHVSAGAKLTVDAVTIEGGRAENAFPNSGGGIFNSGDLTLVDSTLSGNTAGDRGGGIFSANDSATTLIRSTLAENAAGYGGGGIYDNNGVLTVTDSTLSGNASSGGGAIYNRGPATIAGSTIAGNSARFGGGIFHRFGTVSLADSVLSGNSAGLGGAVYNRSGATLTIDRSVFTENAANILLDDVNAGRGGAIDNHGEVTVNCTTLSGNTAGGGGGIYNRGSATASVTASTLSGNTASFGGAIFNAAQGAVAVNRSTLSGNSVPGLGGGIGNFGDLTVTGGTITGNSAGSGGGGISSNGEAQLRSTIVAGNVGPSPDVMGIFFAAFSLIGDVGGASVIGVGGGHNLIGSGVDSVIDALLGPLQNNGGPTKTHGLQLGSPAIDAGDSLGVDADQRGLTRPVTIVEGHASPGDDADIGAWELQTRSLRFPMARQTARSVRAASP